MERYLINGGKKLSGSVEMSSAKNSVLPLLAGSVLTDDEVIIENCPKISDVLVMIKILESLGAKIHFEDNNLVIKPEINSCAIPVDLAKKMRSSIFLMGALISEMNMAVIHYPGGCDIGQRPIDIHLDALEKLGVKFTAKGDTLECVRTENISARIVLPFPSVGATENVILASVFSDGITEIINGAKEPEIIDLMKFLNSMGAKIKGVGTDKITVEGVKKLHGTTFRPMPDRIETGTFLIGAAITGGDIEIKNANAKNISSLIHKLCYNTCKIDVKNDIIYLKSGGSRKSFSFSTEPYPGFPTDMQAQTVALLSVSNGTSFVYENIFETRYRYVTELVKMGADIKIKGRLARIKGVRQLSGNTVSAYDLRGGAAMVLAGLNASGKTIVNDIRHIDRGYYQFDKKLLSLGADIIRESTKD